MSKKKTTSKKKKKKPKKVSNTHKTRTPSYDIKQGKIHKKTNPKKANPKEREEI